MNTIDAMKEILKDNRKKYKINYESEEFIIKRNLGVIVIESAENEGEGLVLENIVVLQLEGWEEVKKPVDFMTAVKSGRKVRVEHEFISEPYEKEQLSNEYKHLVEIFGIFARCWGDYAVVDIVENGKWYIED